MRFLRIQILKKLKSIIFIEQMQIIGLNSQQEASQE